MYWEQPLEDVLGSCDTLKFGRIRRCTIESCGNDLGEVSHFLELEVHYAEDYWVTIRIVEPKELSLGTIDVRTWGFGELFVDSLAGHGLEGIQYQLHDELHGPSCYCQDLQILRIARIEQDGDERVLFARPNERLQ